MNKRQAKKAFKKKYGCTPNQAAYIINIFSEFDWCETAKGIGESISIIIKAFTEAISNISIAVTEFMKVMYGEEDKT